MQKHQDIYADRWLSTQYFCICQKIFGLKDLLSTIFMSVWGWAKVERRHETKRRKSTELYFVQDEALAAAQSDSS